MIQCRGAVRYSAELFNDCYVHAVISQAPQPPVPRVNGNAGDHEQLMPGELNSLQMAEGEYEGTNYDLFWGIVFGYILNVLMLLYVKCM